MKTKLRVVLFCSLILLLFLFTTLRSIWNANHSQIPLVSNQWNAARTGGVVESDEIGEGGIKLWRTWHRWIQPDGTLYTSEQATSHTMSKLLKFLSSSQIVSVSPATKGTQLKVLFLLEGGQRAVFRPMRYPRDHVIEEGGNKGADRHNGEIAAFHLARILGITRVPPVVGRRINLETVKSVSHPSLADTIYRDTYTHNMCMYGICHYCTETDPACGEGDTLEGSLSLWLPDRYQLKSLKHPCWNREFKCRRELLRSHPFSAGPALLDLMETAVFDFLIGNMDRHHLDVFEENFATNRLILLDNGKSFGNPFRDEFLLLKPIQQICKFRNSTYQTLLTVSKNPSLSTRLQHSLQTDPIAPVLTQEHLIALDRRLRSAVDIIQQCTQVNGDSVFEKGGYN